MSHLSPRCGARVGVHWVWEQTQLLYQRASELLCHDVIHSAVEPTPTPPRHINVVWRLKSCLELLHPLIRSIRGEHSSWRHERVSYFIVKGTDMYLLIAKWPALILCLEHNRLLVDWNKNITEYYGHGWSAPGFIFKRARVRISTQQQSWLTLLLVFIGHTTCLS